MKKVEIGRSNRTHGKMRNVYKILIGKPERKRRLEVLRIDGRMILEGLIRYSD
jgi:hypothetical protein